VRKFTQICVFFSWLSEDYSSKQIHPIESNLSLTLRVIP